MTIHDDLVHLGLGDSQARVWLACLRLGDAAAVDIAREAGIRRTTAYQALEELGRQGLVAATPGGRRRTWRAEPPAVLEERHRHRSELLRRILPDLKAWRKAVPGRPRVVLHDGVEGIRRVNEDLLRIRPGGSYRYISGGEDVLEPLGQAWLEDLVRRRVARGIRSYSIRVRARETAVSALGPGERWLREVRYVDRPVYGDLACLYLYDGTVAVTSTRRESYALVIHSRELHDLLLFTWETLWHLLPVMPGIRR